MSDGYSRTEIDAKLAQSAAETDTKIARIEGKLDLVISKLDAVRDDNRVSRTNMWVIGFGLAAVMVAVAALFPIFFGLGAQIRELAQREVQIQFQSQPVQPPNTPQR
jgi:hypothetical protein